MRDEKVSDAPSAGVVPEFLRDELRVEGRAGALWSWVGVSADEVRLIGGEWLQFLGQSA